MRSRHMPGRSAEPRRVAGARLHRRARPRHPVGAAEEIARALPEGLARLEIIAGAGHFTWMDAPGRYWPVVTRFLRSVISPVAAS